MQVFYRRLSHSISNVDMWRAPAPSLPHVDMYEVSPQLGESALPKGDLYSIDPARLSGRPNNIYVWNIPVYWDNFITFSPISLLLRYRNSILLSSFVLWLQNTISL